MKTRITVAVMLLIGVLLSGCAFVGDEPDVEACVFAIDPAYAVELVAYSDAVSFEWRLDGQILYGKRVVCELSRPGEYTATVIATGSNGMKSTDEIEFKVDFIAVCFWEDGDCWTCTYREGKL